MVDHIEVPALPALKPDLLDHHHRAHAHLAEIEKTKPTAVRNAFRLLSHQRQIESLANLHPVLVSPTHPLLFPAPRAFLTDELLQREAGARAAFLHIDCRTTMFRDGAISDMIESSTPEVLNALLQGPVESETSSNPGLVRATMTSWKPEANPFEHPAPGLVRPLLEGAIDMVSQAPSPAITRGAWLAYTMMTVHPFVDGNGRTARACFLGVVSPELGLGTDWGALEQWSLTRHEYVTALQDGQQTDAYRPHELDATPFMDYATRSSIRGVDLSLARLEALERLVDYLTEQGLDSAAADIILTVALKRFVVMRDLGHSVSSPSLSGPITDLVADLVDQEFLRWCQVPVGSAARQRPGTGVALGNRGSEVSQFVAIATLAPTS